MLRRDEHHAISTAVTIDGSGGSILEHGERLDVGGIDRTQRALDAIDEDEGAAVVSEGADVKRRLMSMTSYTKPRTALREWILRSWQFISEKKAIISMYRLTMARGGIYTMRSSTNMCRQQMMK